MQLLCEGSQGADALCIDVRIVVATLLEDDCIRARLGEELSCPVQVAPAVRRDCCFLHLRLVKGIIMCYDLNDLWRHTILR